MTEMTPARLRAFIRCIEKPSGNEGCWLWTGALNSNGYGMGATGVSAHRLAYEWMVGPIPYGRDLDHLCRNRACVNPHHLEPVTRSVNVLRAMEGRVRPAVDFCRYGHQMTGDNVRMWSNGEGVRPQCYRCRRERDARRRVRTVVEVKQEVA